MSIHWVRAVVMAAALSVLMHLASKANADEGMWLFNNPPRKLLKDKYQFDATDKWLEHVQKASVRFNSGGSGSFVSADGLVMTNHHVGADCLQKLSTKEQDYLQTGFHARTRAEEVKCLDLELNVLMSIEDVTARVQAAVKPNMAPAEAQQARRAVINTLEKESLDTTGLRSDVVPLYQGGLYHLYRFKKYTDVRLVFAPEKTIAFFGGDPDNFEYPRYDLDVCFFRAYEDGKPAKIEHYLKWSKTGAKESDLIFVSGHPGRTDRLDTVAHLEFLRDHDFPLRLDVIRRREVLLKIYSDKSRENARQAQDELFSYQNSRKARLGMLAGLQDPSVMNKKRAEEKALRDKVVADSHLQKSYGDAWELVASALRQYQPLYHEHYLLERGAAFNSELFGIARTLVRLADESRKLNAERLREYSEAGQESLKQQLFSAAPIYPELETVKLADSLSMWMTMAGADNELVKQVLIGKSPQERAAALVQGSKLADVAVRRKLADGGRAAIETSDDPMIRLARLVDGPARSVRKIVEEKVDEPFRQAYGKIALARFAVYGRDHYPDATFTLRLSFGQVKGYSEGGRQIPWRTTLGGTYEHARKHGSKEPFELPRSWLERKDRLNLDTPFNFVSTADIIGGNSGSPVLNKDAEVVGLIFDGNRHSLIWDFIYTEEQGRAVAVHSQGILEALRNVYDAKELLSELGGKQVEPKHEPKPPPQRGARSERLSRPDYYDNVLARTRRLATAVTRLQGAIIGALAYEQEERYHQRAEVALRAVRHFKGLVLKRDVDRPQLEADYLKLDALLRDLVVDVRTLGPMKRRLLFPATEVSDARSKLRKAVLEHESEVVQEREAIQQQARTLATQAHELYLAARRNPFEDIWGQRLQQGVAEFAESAARFADDVESNYDARKARRAFLAVNADWRRVIRFYLSMIPRKTPPYLRLEMAETTASYDRLHCQLAIPGLPPRLLVVD